ncbi:MAG: leucyl/phenylalanyl-tRNA--protein transferase [Pseudomonadota bacterium]
MTGFGPDALVECYRRGVFPMADERDAVTLYLMDPDRRAVFDVAAFQPSKSMRKFARKTYYTVTFNTAFHAVITACAELREQTWISHGIQSLYSELHRRGEAHSVEVWDGEALIGGLYGVSQGGAFFGESMFSTQSNASKLALMHLMEHLSERGFILLDAQYMTDHLASLGAIEVSRSEYHRWLGRALSLDVGF